MNNQDSFKYIKKLSQVKSNAGIQFLSPAAFPGSHCPLHTAIRTATDIEGMSSLVIGTQECSFYSRLILEAAKGPGPELHWMYVLDAKEVVFGCRQGLMEAIKEMDAQGVKGIMLISTCVPELIGEDIESIAFELKDEVGTALFPIRIPHFRCNSYPSGLWKSFESLVSFMEPNPKKAKRVNILGGFMDSGLEELTEEIKKAGYMVFHAGIKKKLVDIKPMSEAALNLVLSSWDLPWAVAMEKKFEIPYLSLHSAYSAKQIEAIYQQLQESLPELPLDSLHTSQNKLLELEQSFRTAFHGKSFILTEKRIDGIPLALYLTSLGMIPLALHVEEFFPEDKQWSEELLKLGVNPWVFHSVNPQADAALLTSLQPDFCLGALPAKGSNIPQLPALPQLNSKFGYQRTIELLSNIFKEEMQNGLA